MCTVLLPPVGNPLAVNKYIISYIISYHHIISNFGLPKPNCFINTVTVRFPRLSGIMDRNFTDAVVDCPHESQEQENVGVMDSEMYSSIPALLLKKN